MNKISATPAQQLSSIQVLSLLSKTTKVTYEFTVLHLYSPLDLMLLSVPFTITVRTQF